MRFISRALVGIALIISTFAFIGFGVVRIMDARQAGDHRAGGPTKERVFAVNIDVLTKTTTQPVITAYGVIRGWRTMEIRAVSPGRVLDVSQIFRDGAAVNTGEFLVLIDPVDSESRRQDAEAGLEDARAELNDASRAVQSAQQELISVTMQRDLRKQALDRQKQLFSKGISTEISVEEAEISWAIAVQSFTGLRESIAAEENRVKRAKLKIQRAQISLDDANRAIRDTRVEAAFDGLLANTNAVPGRLIAANEKLGDLIDPTALEAVFQVTNTAFSHLIDAQGNLIQQPVRVTLNLGDVAISTRGFIDRVAATVTQGQSGRQVFAKLAVAPETVLRPGDFVTVTINEPALSDIAIIPATAATEDGRLFLLDSESRLLEHAATILRRQGDFLLVDNVPFGSTYVVERLPQLGTGVLVTARAAIKPDQPALPVDDTTEKQEISLTEKRRSAIVAFVEDNQHMPSDRKKQILSILAKPSVPRELIESIEKQMASKG